MNTIKKLAFAPFFLICLLILFSQLNSILISYNLLFSFDLSNLMQFLLIAFLLNLSAFLFTIFATISSEGKFIFPIAFLSSALSFLFLPLPASLFLAIGVFISLILTFVSLENSLKTDLNFNPYALLGPSIRHLTTFFIIVFCAVYFTFISKQVLEKGFQIPDSLIDSAINLASGLGQTDKSETSAPKLSISKEQIELLRQNPDLLRQSGLDPSILDTLDKPQRTSQSKDLTKDFTKQLVKDQLDTVLKPYLSFIPAVLAVLLFLTLQSLTSILNLLIYPLLWLTFYILEKTGFIKFTTEMRPVKKIVV